MKTLLQLLFAVVVTAFTVHAASPDQLSGFSETIRVGTVLFDSLEPEQQAGFSPRPVALETDPTPTVHLGEFTFNGRPLKVVVVSTGFIELMRRVAKARAFDAVESGYSERYLQLLATTDPAKGVPELPNGKDPKFDSETLLNNQRTYFAQMVSMVVAIEMSHYYLGHYEKYAGKMAPGMPINAVIKHSDWQKSIDKGTEHSLGAGYGPEAISNFYAALERMARKPSWTAYFLPPDENVGKLNTRLAKIEKKFFNFN